MKHKIIIAFVFLIISVRCFSQAPLLGEYRTDNNIDKFVGIWQWTSGADTVVIKLKKVKYLNTDPVTYHDDVLMGCHKYVKNGIILEDNISQFVNIGQNYKGSLYGWSNKRVADTLTVYMTFKDVTKNKLELIDMKYVSGTIPQMTWLLYNRTTISGVPGRVPGLTLPSSLVLTKQ
jgi:hypothetical protein